MAGVAKGVCDGSASVGCGDVCRPFFPPAFLAVVWRCVWTGVGGVWGGSHVRAVADGVVWASVLPGGGKIAMGKKEVFVLVLLLVMAVLFALTGHLQGMFVFLRSML